MQCLPHHAPQAPGHVRRFSRWQIREASAALAPARVVPTNAVGGSPVNKIVEQCPPLSR